MKIKLLLIIGLLTLETVVVFGQEKWIENYKIAVFGGGGNEKMNHIPEAENFDFLNYLHIEEEKIEYMVLGFSTQLKFRGNWEAKLKVSAYSDLAPNIINLKTQYFFSKNFGLSTGFFNHPARVGGFGSTYKENVNLIDDGFYKQYSSKTIHDRGLMLGIVYDLNYRILHSRIFVSGGISSLSTFESTVYQKQKRSNFKRKIHYKSKLVPAFFFFPEVELNMDCFKINETRFGLQFQSGWYVVNRAIDYKRTINIWSDNEPDVEQISSPKHKFEKINFDFGIYVNW